MKSRILRLVVSAGLLALVLAFADWHEVWRVLRSVSPAWVLAAASLAFADRVLTNFRWQALLSGRGVPMEYWRLFRVQLAANFVGSFLPGFIGVDAIRIAALVRSGEPANEVIAATLVDRITIALATVLVGAVTILALAQVSLPPQLVKFVLLLALLGVVGVVILLLPPVRRWVRLVLLPRAPERLRHRIHGVADAALAYRHQPRLAIWVGIWTLAIFAVRLLFALSLGHACGMAIPWRDLLLVIPVLWVVVMAPITIGGIGVQDAGYVVLMGLIGIAAPVAVSMSLLEHVLSRAVSLPGALFLRDAMPERPASSAPG